MPVLSDRLRDALAGLRAAGTYRTPRTIDGPMGPAARLEGRGEVLVFCANDYLGLANHPRVREAAAAGLARYGAGTASVRFICGTFACHRVLEERVADFLGTEAALTYTSCWSANEGLLPALAEERDAIVSDETNHASIIDAGRLARARRRADSPGRTRPIRSERTIACSHQNDGEAKRDQASRRSSSRSP